LQADSQSDAEYGRTPDGDAPPEGSVRDLYAKADEQAATLKQRSDERTQVAQQSADMAHAVQTQLAARDDLNAAQDALRTARGTPGADVDKARANVQAARARLRQVTDNPPKAPNVRAENAPGYISTAKLSEALESPELSNPTIEGARTLRAGVKGLIRAYGGDSGLVNLQQAEKIRQAIGDAYDPMGGGINGHVQQLKAVLDQTLDETDAGPAYRAARQAYKDWAAKYDDPSGIASLIKRDAQGNFVNDANWEAVEDRLVRGSSDQAFAQVVRQLRENGDTQALNRLKASVLQGAYEAASRGAQDAGGHSVANGAAYFRHLNDTVGMNKLNTLFSKAELAEIATAGRAALHLNSPVPGTSNSSNSASAVLSSDMAARMMKGIYGKGSGSRAETGLAAASAIGGGVAALAGHTVLGPAASIVGPAAKITADALRARAAAKALAVGLSDAGNPTAARAAAKVRSSRLAEAIRRRGAAQQGSKLVRTAAVASSVPDTRSHRLSAALRRASNR
jgi:hypothetical protein